MVHGPLMVVSVILARRLTDRVRLRVLMENDP